jgi:hypothetical protein
MDPDRLGRRTRSGALSAIAVAAFFHFAGSAAAQLSRPVVVKPGPEPFYETGTLFEAPVGPDAQRAAAVGREFGYGYALSGSAGLVPAPDPFAPGKFETPPRSAATFRTNLSRPTIVPLGADPHWAARSLNPLLQAIIQRTLSEGADKAAER